MNLVTAMPRFASSAATIAFVPPFALMPPLRFAARSHRSGMAAAPYVRSLVRQLLHLGDGRDGHRVEAVGQSQVDRGEVGTAISDASRSSAEPPSAVTTSHRTPRRSARVCTASARRSSTASGSSVSSSALSPPSRSSTSRSRVPVAVVVLGPVGEDVPLRLGQAAEDAVEQPDPAPAGLAQRAGDHRVAGVGRQRVAEPAGRDRGQRGRAPDDRDRAGQTQRQRLRRVDERLGGGRQRSASASSRAAVSARSASLTFTSPRARAASSTGTVSAQRLARAGARRGTGMNGARARSAIDCSCESGAPTATSRAPRRCGRLGGAERLRAASGRATPRSPRRPRPPSRARRRCGAPITGTGQRGPATVASTSPVRAAVPTPATTTARGRPSSASTARFASAASAARLPHLRTGRRGGRSMPPGSASASACGSSSRASSASRRPLTPAVPSIIEALPGAAARLVEQQHRHVVADLEDPPALRAGQRLRLGVVGAAGRGACPGRRGSRATADPGPWRGSFHVCGCDRRRCRPAQAILSANAVEHLVAQRDHPLPGGRLDVEPQQRLGVGRRAG